MADRERNVYEAKLAEQAERYDEMIQAIKRVVALNSELSLEERNLLSVAYKNVIGARRAAWRVISTIEEQDQGSEPWRLAVVAGYRGEIEGEVRRICGDILQLLDAHLLPLASDEESRLFYYKLKGDYNRYLAEIASEEAQEGRAKEANGAYTAATASALAAGLSPAHPLRLGLALNFSVFRYEIMAQTEEAVALAQEAVLEAQQKLDQASSSFRETSLIIKLLKDNVALWTSEDERS